MADTPIIGIITPPNWYDPSAAEFAELCAAPVRTQQSMVDVPDLDFDRLAAISEAEGQVCRAARLLGGAGASAVAMTGTPFVWAGLTEEAQLRARVARVSEAAGCPAIMAGTAIVDTLRALGAGRIAVSTPYYTPEWRAHAERILLSAGFDVLTIMSADQQGLAPEIGSISQHSAVSEGDMLHDSLRHLRDTAPDAEALVVVGAGVRTLSLTPEIEADLGLPVVASDTALYWSLAQTLGLPVRPGRLGRTEAVL